MKISKLVESKFINENDYDKISRFLESKDITQSIKMLEFLEEYNLYASNPIKINISFEIPEDLKLPEPVEEPTEKVRATRSDKQKNWCECCDKTFGNSWKLHRHFETRTHKKNLKKWEQAKEPKDEFK